MTIRPDFLRKIVGRVNTAVGLLQQVPSYPREKDNGYCTLADAEDGRPLHIFQVGVCPPEKCLHRLELSQEKALRIVLHKKDEHVSSWQSRDKHLDRWGGAVLGKGMIVSFSGLPEDADEAVSLVVAVSCGWLTWPKADKIAITSGNAIYPHLRRLWTAR